MTNRFILASAVALTGLAGTALAADGAWQADLAPMNAAVAGSAASGTAVLSLSDDTLTIRIEATDTAPDITHLQHFHGFAVGDAASVCPTVADDANGDGIIDLIETEPLTGVTMVPFHSDPASMAIVADGYPVSDATGAYSYEQEVSLSALEDAFAKEFPDQQLDLERRVIFLHGVPETTDLPESVQSLGDVPAHITLPIACGEIKAAAG